MIRITNNIEDIVPLWSEAFNDSREDIEFFVNRVENAVCIAYYKNKTAVSMLYLVDCILNGKNNHYVYAACTASSNRKKGYMGKLLEHCLEEYNSVCLIPANEHLVEYYTKHGLKHKYSVADLKFNECKELVDDYLYAGCSLDKPIVLSNKGE